MNFVRDKSAVVCLIAMAVVVVALPLSAADTISRSFAVGEGGRLELDADRGSIEVRSASTGAVEVEVIRSGHRAEDFEVEFSNSGDDVTIVGEYPHRTSWGRSPKIRFIITVPRRYNVELKTSGGSISVSDLEGEARVKTSGGSLTLGNIHGEVWGRTSGGSIKLEGCSGRADVKTSGGGIHIGDVDGEVEARTSGGSISIGRVRATVSAHSSGGSITVDEVMGAIQASTSGGSVSVYISEQPKGDCRLTTSGGSVTAYLADNLALDLSAHSGSSKVRCDFDLSPIRKSKRSLSGKLNGGGPELYLRTSGGSVKVLRK